MTVEPTTVKTNCVIWRNIHLPHPNQNCKSPYFNFDESSWYFNVHCRWYESREFGSSSSETWRFDLLHAENSKILNSYIIVPYIETKENYARLASTIKGTQINRSSLSNSISLDKNVITMLFFFMPTFLNTLDFIDIAVETLEIDSDTKPICLESLSEDIVQLFNKDGYSDMILKCHDKSFSVHKNILATRSTVFSKMLEHDMSEKNTGVINIVDLDSNILEQFLIYLYSSKVEKMCIDSAIKLYRTADKYAVHSLKVLCGSYILNNLSRDIVYEVLLLADQVVDTKFFDGVSTFVCKIEGFFKSTEWKDFARKFPAVAVEVYSKYCDMH